MNFRTLWLLAFLSISGGSAPTRAESTPPSAPRRILFFGDSITAGYGLEAEQAFPALVAKKIQAEKWPFEVMNAGLNGETSAAGLRRIDWMLLRKFDYLVLELGANDGLRGLALKETRSNLQQIVDRAKATFPELRVVVAGMRIPPNLGPQYTREFEAIFPALADSNDAALIPFLLEGVAGVPELNLPDGIHPTAAGHRLVADLVWAVLRPLLAADLAMAPAIPGSSD